MLPEAAKKVRFLRSDFKRRMEADGKTMTPDERYAALLLTFKSSERQNLARGRKPDTFLSFMAGGKLSGIFFEAQQWHLKEMPSLTGGAAHVFRVYVKERKKAKEGRPVSRPVFHTEFRRLPDATYISFPPPGNTCPSTEIPRRLRRSNWCCPPPPLSDFLALALALTVSGGASQHAAVMAFDTLHSPANGVIIST